MKLCLAVLLVMLSAASYGQTFPMPPTYHSAVGNSAGQSSPQGACTINNAGTFSTAGAQPSAGFCNGSPVAGTCAVNGGPICEYRFSCPANSTNVGGQCQCAAGFSINGTNTGCSAGPPPPPPCSLQVGALANNFAVGGPGQFAPSSVCSGGCKMNLGIATGASDRTIINGVTTYYSMASYNRSTETCTVGQGGLSAPPQIVNPNAPQSCGAGQSPGTVNNVFMCVANGSGQPASTTPVAAADPKTTTSDTVTVPTANGGSQSTTTTSTGGGVGGVGASITVTVVTKDGAGNVTGSTTSEKRPGDQLKDFCETNPSNKLCSKSIWAGTCIAGFTCEGDAVTCAIARATNAARCDQEKITSLTDLGTAILNGNDPDAPNLPQKDNPRTVSLGDIDQSGWMSRACISDQTLPIGWGGVEITIPWSRLCTALEIMGHFMVIAALLGAARIIGVT